MDDNELRRLFRELGMMAARIRELRNQASGHSALPDTRKRWRYLNSAANSLDSAESAIYEVLPRYVEGQCNCPGISGVPDGPNAHWSYCATFRAAAGDGDLRPGCDGLCSGFAHRESCSEHVVPR